MKVLVIGDLVGRSGRSALFRHLPLLKERFSPDFIIANAENAAGGFGLTQKIAESLMEAGVDGITLGNHAWDQREMLAYIEREPRIVRALNYPKGTPGQGAALISNSRGQKLLLVQVMGQLFMPNLNCPFAALDNLLKSHPLGSGSSAVIVDIHAEATGEKVAMAYHLDGRASLLFGTHTHVPTADARILEKGLGYISDLGMTGDYDSVIGMKVSLSLPRLLKKLPGERLAPANGEATLCGLLADINAQGRSTNLKQLLLGGLIGVPE